MKNSEFRPSSTNFNKSLSKERRRKDGIYFTPKSLRDHLFNMLTRNAPNSQTILEPSFGSGEFIYDIIDRFPTSNIVGVELDPSLFASVAASNAALYNADFLEWQCEIKFDLIIGNPPYFVMKPTSQRAKELSTMATTGRTNIFALFLYKCLQMLARDGILAFIIPTSIYNCSYYQPTRTYIAREFTILHAETLQDAAFYGTDQETALLIIKKAADPHRHHIFTANDLAFISPNPESLSLLRSDTTIKSLGLSVKTGNIVWNQVKGDLHETDGTLLIYSSNIANGELTLNNLKGAEKKQYVKSTKEVITEPVILVERGYGNSYSFNSIYVDLKYPFYAENHVNVIYGDIDKLKVVAKSLKDERTQQFIKYFIGNGSVSKTDLETIVPIFV